MDWSWAVRYGDNVLHVFIAVAGVILNLRYIRRCAPGPARTLKALSAVALAYSALLQALYVAGVTLPNNWFEAGAITMAAVLALNAWVGRVRGNCD